MKQLPQRKQSHLLTNTHATVRSIQTITAESPLPVVGQWGEILMGSIRLFDTVGDRAVSPVIGVALVTSFTVLAGIGLFVYGESLVTGDQEPRIDSEFALEYTTDDAEPELAYTTGDDFSSQDAERIFATGTGENGSDYTLNIYDGNSVVDRSYADPPATLQSNMTVIGTERMKERNVSSGATIQVVWVPAGSEDTQIILSETIVPSRDVILQQIDSGGTVTADGEVVINGTAA